jgi:hypothetical protein
VKKWPNEWPQYRWKLRLGRQLNLARVSQAVSQAGANEAVDDEGAEDEIWAVTDITEDDEQDQEDVVAALLELAQWECISVEEQ